VFANGITGFHASAPSGTPFVVLKPQKGLIYNALDHVNS
jgi:hypothetical protein